MTFIVGAYAASPCSARWEPALESKFFSGLRALPSIQGFEIPFYESLHKFDEGFFFRELNPQWSHVVTCLPGTMDRLSANRHFGLASDSIRGRTAALLSLAQARAAVARLNAFLNRPAVIAVQLHSAPSRGTADVSSSTESFADSLRECSGWDWEGASLVVEHCEKFFPGRPSDKGFLSLEDELSAIRSVGPTNPPLGVTINWGRSAIEGHSPETPLVHVKRAAVDGRLRGVMFSGCAANDPLYGAWADRHAPFWRGDSPAHGAENSLMTAERAAACVVAASKAPPLYVGLKIQPLPSSLSVDDRIGCVVESLDVLVRCVPAGVHGPL